MSRARLIGLTIHVSWWSLTRSFIKAVTSFSFVGYLTSRSGRFSQNSANSSLAELRAAVNSSFKIDTSVWELAASFSGQPLHKESIPGLHGKSVFFAHLLLLIVADKLSFNSESTITPPPVGYLLTVCLVAFPFFFFIVIAIHSIMGRVLPLQLAFCA